MSSFDFVSSSSSSPAQTILHSSPMNATLASRSSDMPSTSRAVAAAAAATSTTTSPSAKMPPPLNSTTTVPPSKTPFLKSLKQKFASKQVPSPNSTFMATYHKSSKPSLKNTTTTTTTMPTSKRSTSPSSSPSVSPSRASVKSATSSVAQEVHDCSFKVAVAEDYNLKYRQSMEDAHVYIYNYCDVPDAGYFAIYDGHAGSQAAKWCSENLHDLIRQSILQNEGLLHPSHPPHSEKEPVHGTTEKKRTWIPKRLSISSLASDSDKPSLLMKSPVAEANNKATKKRASSRQFSVSSSAIASSPHAILPSTIPKEERIPLAFKTAFLNADKFMSDDVPAHTGTTAAVAVIRWERIEPLSEYDDKSIATNSSGDDKSTHTNTSTSTTAASEPPADVSSIAAPASSDSDSESDSKSESKSIDPTPAQGQQGQQDQQDQLVPALITPENSNDNDTKDESTQADEGTDTLSELPSNGLHPVVTNGASSIDGSSSVGDADSTFSAPFSHVGSTMSSVSRKSFHHTVVRGNRKRVLYAANVGDSRIVLCRGGTALRLSYDHKGSDPHETARIIKAGGLVIGNRVNGMLAVTRSLGDGYMKSLVTGNPYTTRTELCAEDEFVIIACDGLWDVCTDQEAVELVRDVMDPKQAAKTLVSNAIRKYSSDNITCMVIRLDPTMLD